MWVIRFVLQQKKKKNNNNNDDDDDDDDDDNNKTVSNFSRNQLVSLVVHRTFSISRLATFVICQTGPTSQSRTSPIAAAQLNGMAFNLRQVNY